MPLNALRWFFHRLGYMVPGNSHRTRRFISSALLCADEVTGYTNFLMTHLVAQLCALNEQDYIADVIRSIPRVIPGVDRVTVIVIDDGSTDDTSRVAVEAGADKVVRHPHRRGLAQAFQRGLDEALRLGADIVVNIDADGQYRGEDIPALIQPILAGTAEIVIGDRRPQTLSHFSPVKRSLQAAGS